MLGWSIFILNLAVVPKVKEEQWDFLSTELLFRRKNLGHTEGQQTIWLNSYYFSRWGFAVGINYTDIHFRPWRSFTEQARVVHMWMQTQVLSSSGHNEALIHLAWDRQHCLNLVHIVLGVQMEMKSLDSRILQKIHPADNATLQFLGIHETLVLTIPQLPQSLSWLCLGQSVKSVLRFTGEYGCRQLDGVLVRQRPNMCFLLLHIKNIQLKNKQTNK